MAKLELYNVTIGGIEHTMQLSAQDVERYGDAAVKVVEEPASSTRAKATTAANKAAGAENK